MENNCCPACQANILNRKVCAMPECRCHEAPINTPVGIGARAPKALEHKTCRFHPTGCIDDGAHPMNATSRHAEIPEKFIVTQVGGEKSTVTKYEAPTDEGWIEAFDKNFDYWLTSISPKQQLKLFIASLLQENRQKTLSDQAAFKHGKSEAFSLVRRAVEAFKVGGTSIASSSYDNALKDVLIKLSTLEGK